MQADDGMDGLANHLPRHADFSANRLDRTLVKKIGATDLGNRLAPVSQPRLYDLMKATYRRELPMAVKAGPYSMPKHRQTSPSTNAMVMMAWIAGGGYWATVACPTQRSPPLE
ncbi:hypothetical protein [Bradyrhizobium sp. LTSPM299]|uniref:hypothetical protein n=1 Tax=Bradyrhizobium sp. LTSPM299 TaxID=1619233 RepID=UPI0012E0EBDE|nr:hypothetical protein [Bradyrhizobium sp. LTSPM299]